MWMCRLWPDHCVNNTAESALHPDLLRALSFDPETLESNLSLPQAHTNQARFKAVLLAKKGIGMHMDAYSGFYDNGHIRETGLAHELRSYGIISVHVAGLALDFCVLNTALDAARMGFNTSVVVDACRAVNEEGRVSALQQLRDAGIHLLAVGSASDQEGQCPTMSQCQ